MTNNVFYPIVLQPSFHETLWGGRRLEYDGWKQLPPGNIAIGEAWETEINTIVQNGPYTGHTLGSLVEQLGVELLGTQTIAIVGKRFPLLAKFIDANAQLSVQVHPNDDYATAHENGKLGKTEFWYILAAEPHAKIVYGFKQKTTQAAVQRAIQECTLETLLHEEEVDPGDVIFVPAGTVHAIGSGVLLYELQQYSDITYRMYDYGRLSANGKPRELHIERSLEVSHYHAPQRVKATPVPRAGGYGYEERCLAACQYFVTRELTLKQQHNGTIRNGGVEGITSTSCIILSSLGAETRVYYGETLEQSETLSRGKTMVLPAALGKYHIVGDGTLLMSYVPTTNDEAWQQWLMSNQSTLASH